METIIKQLTSSSYWTLNKDLCRSIGLQNTLVLQHFIDLQYKLFGGKEFYQQQERLQEELGLKEWSVKQSINFLLKEGLITVEKKGIPAKNYYLISEEKVTSLVSSKPPNQSGENHLTRELEITSQRKELNKKELNKKELNIKELNKNNNINIVKQHIAIFPEKYQHLL
jgi:predicted transcriptional regulator